MANDTGSNYWFIPGGETPAPPVAPPVQEPVSPFPAVNYLQDPVQLLMNPGGGTAPVSGPSFTPQAAPAAMRLDMPQTIVPPTAPVTPQLPTTTPEPPAPPVQPPAPQPETPPAVEPGTHFGPKPLDFGDPFFDNDGNQWIWDENNPEWGYWKFNTPQTPPTQPVISQPPQTGGEPIVTPPRESIVLPPEAITTTPVQPIITPPQPPVTPQPPVVEPEPLLPEVVTINRPTFPIYEPPPSRGPVTIPGTAVSSRPVLQPIEPIAQVAPTTIPVPTRQDMSFSPSRYDYINYDPEEILAAAMRAMGNSRIRQSITDEAVQNRMFSRMR
jgi:hypothetical protein